MIQNESSRPGATLVIMAAGLGTRYGGGIKQLEPVGPNGEIIMDYSIHDAMEAGFDRVIFIIRRDIEAAFEQAIGERIRRICADRGVRVDYAFQELDDLPDGFTCPEGRTKPWGTGQAVLACRAMLDEPFVVINADDYYGKQAFHKLYRYLQQQQDGSCCMAGFYLQNTLSDFGGVTRGICEVDGDGWLVSVKETRHIIKTADGAGIQNDDGSVTPVDGGCPVSMNMWGLTGSMLGILEREFQVFLSQKGREMTAEFLLPIVIDQLLERGEVRVQVLETGDKWFGVTYQEDKPLVVESFRRLIQQGVYQEKLYE